MSNGQKQTFQRVDNPKVLIPVLQERHPQSCAIYNQVISHDRSKDDVIFYTLGASVNSDTWIVSDYIREDYGHNVSISAPRDVVEGRVQVPLEVKESFSSSDIFDWDNGILFASLAKRVSSIIFDISANVKGNVTEVHPCILYYMDIDEALKLEITPGPEVSEVRRLLPDKESDFILSTWNYTKPKTEIVVPKIISAYASAGVFVDGKCVSGVITPGIGLISALYTLKEFRNMGYGKLTMKYAFKEFAKDGCIPCLTVEIKNERSIAFHQSLGVKAASVVDWIDVKKLNID